MNSKWLIIICGVFWDLKYAVTLLCTMTGTCELCESHRTLKTTRNLKLEIV
jgi:hypothetical protein